MNSMQTRDSLHLHSQHTPETIEPERLGELDLSMIRTKRCEQRQVLYARSRRAIAPESAGECRAHEGEIVRLAKAYLLGSSSGDSFQAKLL